MEIELTKWLYNLLTERQLGIKIPDTIFIGLQGIEIWYKNGPKGQIILRPILGNTQNTYRRIIFDQIKSFETSLVVIYDKLQYLQYSDINTIARKLKQDFYSIQIFSGNNPQILIAKVLQLQSRTYLRIYKKIDQHVISYQNDKVYRKIKQDAQKIIRIIQVEQRQNVQNIEFQYILLADEPILQLCIQCSLDFSCKRQLVKQTSYPDTPSSLQRMHKIEPKEANFQQFSPLFREVLIKTWKKYHQNDDQVQIGHNSDDEELYTPSNLQKVFGIKAEQSEESNGLYAINSNLNIDSILRTQQKQPFIQIKPEAIEQNTHQLSQTNKARKFRNSAQFNRSSNYKPIHRYSNSVSSQGNFRKVLKLTGQKLTGFEKKLKNPYSMNLFNN